MDINKENNIKESIKKVLYIVLKKVFVVTDQRSFELCVEMEGEDNITLMTKLSDEILWKAKIILKECVSIEINVNPQRDQSPFFVQCLIESFIKIYVNTRLLNGITSKTEEYANEIYQYGCKIFSEKIKKNFRIDLDIIQNISSMYYEREECQGWFFFSFSSDIKMAFKLCDNKILSSMDNSRKIRKMLEMTKEAAPAKPTALVFFYSSSIGWELHGMADIDISQANGIWFHFFSYMNWEMGYHKRIIINKDGLLQFPIQQYNIQFMNKIKEMMKPYNIQQYDKLWDIIEAGRKQEHGTILVIFGNDENQIIGETKRLVTESSGNRLEKPKILSKKRILQITAIDGAVIMDIQRRIYGYGFILDGSAKISGDNSRGSRYNNTRKYIASQTQKDYKTKALAIIISEDRMINFYSTDDYLREEKENGEH